MDWSLNDDGFTLTRPQLLRPWYNFISNQDYSLKISHLGDGYATRKKPDRVEVTHYNPYSRDKGRYFYVKEAGVLWSPAFLPTGTDLDSYNCTHAPGSTRFDSVKNGLRVTVDHFLPLEGAFEFLTISLCNETLVHKTVELYSLIEFLLYPDFGVDPTYYSWYVDSQWDETQRELQFSRRSPGGVPGFCRSLAPVTGWDADLRAVIGNGNLAAPESIVSGSLGSRPSGGGPYGAVFGFTRNLESRQSCNICLIIGAGDDACADSAARFKTQAAVYAERDRVHAWWKSKLDTAQTDSVPPGTYRSWLKGFLPYQVRMQSLGEVRGVWRGYRDVAQDAMALCHYDAPQARTLLLELCRRQHDDGRCPRQWNVLGGKDDERDFRDLPFWLPIALHDYLSVTNDFSILDERLRWSDSEAVSSFCEHMIKGLRYVLQYREDGLLKMGAGDWNDALNGPGPEGGSVFLNQIAYYALSLLAPLATHQPLAGALAHYQLDIAAECDRLYAAVDACWNGSWFTRAVSASGVILGGDERLYLLPQAWFTISGMAARNPSRANIALDSMLARLETDDGLIKCSPGFDTVEVSAGSVSYLAPGMAENYAIYNHASAFGAYALLEAGRNEEAARILGKLMPFAKDWQSSKSEPYVFVNFYNGGFYPHKKGEGGISWLTGTVNWFVKALYTHMLEKGIMPCFEQ